MSKQTTIGNEGSATYQHRAVQDLAWALRSPPLFESIPDYPPHWFALDYIDDDLANWLNLLDQNPDELFEHLAQQRSTRLGIYFEQLLSFYFCTHPRFELLAKNLQVTDNKRTLGEFDFIIFDKHDQRFKHIEAAVKFYLGHNPYRGTIANNLPLHNWHNWVGPNQRDSLAIKMRHLHNHQLALATNTEGLAQLRQLGIDSIESRLHIKGRFYKDANNSDRPLYSQQTSNIWYRSLDMLNQPDGIVDTEKYYALLPRQYWLSNISLSEDFLRQQDLYSAEDIIALIKRETEEGVKEWQLAEFTRRQIGASEQRRFFILNSQYLPLGESNRHLPSGG